MTTLETKTVNDYCTSPIPVVMYYDLSVKKLHTVFCAHLVILVSAVNGLILDKIRKVRFIELLLTYL